MNRAFRRALAILLIVVGGATAAWVAVTLLHAASSRHKYEKTLERMRETPPGGVRTPAVPETLNVGDPIGTLEIERLGLSGVVAEGDEDSVLDVAIGHLPDTPLPWHGGNSALAAHRDALFRSLREIRLGDTMTLKTPHGDFDYRVRETVIVMPRDLWVLDPTPVPTLTLISCYPFNYIGNAPKRFVVMAERMGWVSTEPAALEIGPRKPRARTILRN